MSETREYYTEKLSEAEARISELEEELLEAQQQLAACDCVRESAPKLETTCAWCAEEMGLAPGERGSTGICERHRAEFIAQAFSERHSGKRVEQVLFSAAVLLVALALGLLVGAWVAVWRFGGMGVLK